MREAGFVRDSMLYHLLPIGINFSIDKSIVFYWYYGDIHLAVIWISPIFPIFPSMFNHTIFANTESVRDYVNIQHKRRLVWGGGFLKVCTCFKF